MEAPATSQNSALAYVYRIQLYPFILLNKKGPECPGRHPRPRGWERLGRMIDEGIYLGGYTQKKALNVWGDIQGLGGEVTQLRRRVNS